MRRAPGGRRRGPTAEIIRKRCWLDGHRRWGMGDTVAPDQTAKRMCRSAKKRSDIHDIQAKKVAKRKPVNGHSAPVAHSHGLHPGSRARQARE